MTTETKAPAARLRDGSLEIAIWANETEKGIRYSADGVTRSYKDGEEWKKTTSLSGREHLAAARLHELAYTKELELREEAKAQQAG